MTQADAWSALDPFDDQQITDLPHDDQQVIGRVRSTLADSATWDGPPPALRERLMAAARAEVPTVGSLPQAVSVKRSATDSGVVVPLRRARRPRWLGAAAGFVAGAAAAAVTALIVVTNPSPAGETFELAATARNPDAVVTADVDPQSAGVAIILNIKGLPAAPEGMYYAAWLEGDSGIVPVGTFHWRAGGVPIELWSGVTTDRYPRLFVTLQDEAGPAGPSDAVVLEGIVS